MSDDRTGLTTEADREITEAQWAELTRNKSLKRKKNGEAELQFRKTLFKLWLLLLRHFVLFLLKEWLLYIAESSGYFDEICNTTYKWPRGKELSNSSHLSRYDKAAGCAGD